MNHVIMCTSCQRDQYNGYNEAVRAVWGRAAKQAGFGFQLVIGGEPMKLFEDELASGQPDAYHEMPFKTQWSCRWAYDHGFDFMFQCFTDTYLSVPRMLKFIPGLSAPITGNFWFTGRKEDHACGGSGYWINREAMLILAEAPCTRELLGGRDHWAEDRWANHSLTAVGVHGRANTELFDHESRNSGVRKDNQNITNHLSYCGHRYSPVWMAEEQEQEITGRLAARR